MRAKAKATINVGGCGSSISSAQWRVNISTASVLPTASQNSDGDESSNEEQIKKNGEGAKGGDTSNKERQKDGEQGVEDGSGGNDLDGDDPASLGKVIGGQSRKEVGEYAENEQSGEELDDAEESLKRLERETALLGHGCVCFRRISDEWMNGWMRSPSGGLL